ncbi:hypothetical protein CCACVL1_17643 [Corchorus capsularis]|uniref:Uncharacterized protein n=1 Tax=Corchorus capsularis TaxID=210143 RepID=A0A1R3HR49_COCAP|nr:hypothetical protein CCACVL1_17643 [Corchorus capsularis]
MEKLNGYDRERTRNPAATCEDRHVGSASIIKPEKHNNRHV